MTKRIFWLGMHKVLSQTELPRLRKLGFEVYNPPYLSDVYDQSAVYDWKESESSTLPSDVHKLLSETNFFYDEIPEGIARLLNEHFDAIIVTINPTWLLNFLKAYNGKIIYRTYGQPYSLSQELINNGAFRLIVERENFWFCPHSEKVVGFEDDWLRARMKIVPYCLTEDVVALRDTWRFEDSEASVGLLCPRAIDIPYYAEQYEFIKQNFPGRAYKIFGAQNIAVADPKIIGTVERDVFLQLFGQMRAFAYHYAEPTVCYLPPIEFMTLGGPVIFQDGSLLSRYFKTDTPGRAKTTQDLVSLAEKLRAGDLALSNEIVESQKTVRTLYQPEYVWPIFDRAMAEMLGSAGDNAATNLFYVPRKPTAKRIANTAKRGDGEGRQILLPFHGFGPLIVRRDGKYHCSEGIARVVRQFVRALADEKFTVIVTSREPDVARVYGFLASGVEDVTKLKILNVDAVEDTGANGIEKPDRRPFGRLIDAIRHKAKTVPVSAYHERFKSLLKGGAYLSLMKSLVTYFTVVVAKVALRLKTKLKANRPTPIPPVANGYVDRLNADNTISDVLIPHYHMFPELQELKDKRVTLYLPDYLPHFYQGSLEMGSSRENEEIGRQLSTMAERVVTNSAFTKEYLPRTGLNIAAEKIVHIPLPFLHEESDEQEHGTDAVELSLPEHFVFYPTRNRPSKRLKDFVATIEKANKQLKKMGRSERIHGVMTTHLSPGTISKAAQPYVTILEELSDSQLGKVYNKSLCLLFTSEMEGNFPTQITEALNLRVPVVASAMPLVVAELGDVGDALDLQKTGDIDGYVDRILDILDNRPSVIEKQATAREFALENFAYEKFRDRLCEVFIPSKN